MVRVDVIGGKLGGDSTPGKRKSGADHRQRGCGPPRDRDHVGHRREKAEADQREHDHLIAYVGRGVGGRRERRPQDSQNDRHDGDQLAPAGTLIEHALTEEQQDEQACRKRRLDDDQGREQKSDDLKGKAEDRNAGARKKARPFEQVTGQRQAQMLMARRPLGVHRLQRHS